MIRLSCPLLCYETAAAGLVNRLQDIDFSARLDERFLNMLYTIAYLMRTYSTKQVADAVGINRVTLQRWLISEKLPEPERLQLGGIDVRVWKDVDVDRVLKYKQANYRKGRGRKKTPKK